MRRTLLAGLAALGLLIPLAPAADKDKPADAKPIRALLVLGGCCHDYAKQKDILSKGIAARANVEVTIAYDPDTTAPSTSTRSTRTPTGPRATTSSSTTNAPPTSRTWNSINRILKPHQDGLPAVVLHCGMHCYRSEGWPKTGSRPGSSSPACPPPATAPRSRSPSPSWTRTAPSPRAWRTGPRSRRSFTTTSRGKVLDTAHPLARGKQGKDDNVCVWTNTYNKNTRVFATTLGHNNETVADDRYLDLVTRGLLWATGPPDRRRQAGAGV